VLAMAREGLRFPLTGALRQALGREDEVVLDHVRVKSNGETTLVRVVVQHIGAPEALRGFVRVSFEPLAELVAPPRPRTRGRKVTTQEDQERAYEHELLAARNELQKTREELETSYEEFQSTNEEMQSTNEELQSTNEELESAKEELQSLNEELQTVNTELQTKVESLSEAHDDMANLLNSTDIATIFLDNKLHVKRFTPQAREVFHLIQADIGRPLSDIVSALHYDRLVQDAQEILQTLAARDQEVQADTQTWYLMRMRPYRTARNVIDGVVITFINITPLKFAEEARQRAETARRLAEDIVQSVREPLVILDAEMHIVLANQRFYQYFHVTPEEATQQSLFALGDGQWDIPALRQRLTEVVDNGAPFEGLEVARDFPRLGPRVIRFNASLIPQRPGEGALVLLAIEIVTTHQQAHEPGSDCV
jgi:two-component system CheB/CheR fusion protein